MKSARISRFLSFLPLKANAQARINVSFARLKIFFRCPQYPLVCFNNLLCLFLVAVPRLIRAIKNPVFKNLQLRSEHIHYTLFINARNVCAFSQLSFSLICFLSKQMTTKCFRSFHLFLTFTYKGKSLL